MSYLKPATEMTDEELESWHRNFQTQPLVESCWASSVEREYARRQAELGSVPTEELVSRMDTATQQLETYRRELARRVESTERSAA